MPVEIMELIVRAQVQEGPSSSSSPVATNSQEEGASQKQAIIEECVEQVLEILRRQKER